MSYLFVTMHKQKNNSKVRT